MSPIIGRVNEQRVLQTVYCSDEAELVAVYGRRRIGKTYLIKHFFQAQKCTYFHITGINQGKIKVQLERFAKVMSSVFYPGVTLQTPATWMAAFDQLGEAMSRLPADKKIVLFFDELPWLAHRRSGMLQALEYFWNRHWVDDQRVKLVVCGSSSSWMVHHVLRNRGGLHNRVTRKMKLMPFTLRESQLFLEHHGCQLSQQQLLRLYMAMGGVPYYLKQVLRNASVDQNINQLFFDVNGLFFEEFDEVFFSLFDNAEAYKELVRVIAQSKTGIQRDMLAQSNKLTGTGGYLSKRLDELELSGFVTSFLPLGHQRRGKFYRLSDPYCYFYLRWVDPVKEQLKREHSTQYWLSAMDSPAYYHWAGYAFENVCYQHLALIRQAMSLPLASLGSPWHYVPSRSEDASGAQIDLVFDRPDHAVTLCEMKYTEKAFVIDRAYEKVLQNKKNVFTEVMQCDRQIFMAMVVAGGLKSNQYVHSLIDHVVTLDDLFADA